MPEPPRPAAAPDRAEVPDRPLRADARRNRDKILAAARDAFATSGYGVPLDEIAALAVVGPGTVYRHFPTKEALFEAVVTARVEDLLKMVRGNAQWCETGSREGSPAHFDGTKSRDGSLPEDRNLVVDPGTPRPIL